MEDALKYIKEDNRSYIYFISEDNVVFNPKNKITDCIQYLKTVGQDVSNITFFPDIDKYKDTEYYNYNKNDILPYCPYIVLKSDVLTNSDDLQYLVKYFRLLDMEFNIEDNLLIWKWNNYNTMFVKFTFIRLLLFNENYRKIVYRIKDFYPTMSLFKALILALYSSKIFMKGFSYKYLNAHAIYEYKMLDNNINGVYRNYQYSFVYPIKLDQLGIKEEHNVIEKDFAISDLFYNVRLFIKDISNVVLNRLDFSKEELNNLIKFLDENAPDKTENFRIGPRSFYSKQLQPAS